ncbi:2-(1,2-epoxy-1,2-dihydrophenyl)acetyl-CoA isomerase [bacterium]|nr:2-(1,2-epoxy-1,2-dihydrophenyl)acetyl-CoA isomerase [bacterium]
MPYDTLNYAVDDGIATLTLNRPKQLNALNGDLSRELGEAFDAAAADDAVRAILITGEGRGFSAGADIANPGDLPMDADGKIDLGAALEARYNPLIKTMRACPKPVIGAVNGIAAGVGCSIALNCDLTVAARSAQFLLAFVNIGLIPDGGATWFIPRTAGHQRAMGMALLGQKLPADTARDWGLVWDVVDDDALMDTARGLAERLANGPAISIRGIKQSIYAAEDNDLPTQLDMERDLQRGCGQTQDFMEGVAAFAQKRKPSFKGR